MIEAKIRKANVKDAAGIATVHVKMWQKAYRGLVPDSFLDNMSIEKRTEVWRDSLKNPKEGILVYVSENEGGITGWIMGGKNRDEDVSQEVGELGGIYIHPDMQSKGVGSKLMESFLQKLKDEGYKKATLWVLDTNKKTRKWYESKGWKVEGKTKTEPREGFELHEVRYIIDL